MKLKQFFNSPKRCIQHNEIEHLGGGMVACCLSGALEHCYIDKDKRKIAEEKLTNYIRRYAHCRWIETFNDNPRRKFEDIQRIVTKLDI